MIDKDQLNYWHAVNLGKSGQSKVEWKTGKEDHSYPKGRKVKAETVDCIIAGIQNMFCFCTVCQCNCCVCWESTQWDKIVLKPDETVHTFPWFMEMEEIEEGVEELKVKRGRRLDDVLMKLGWKK